MDPPQESEGMARLAPSARAVSTRVRLGVGAAVVLMIAALAISVVISAAGAGGETTTLGSAGSDSVTSDARVGAGGSDPVAVPEADSTAIAFVHVLGAVRTPGLYEVHDGARVVDVVAAAGGFGENADPAGVNLARPVSDGEQLYVPQMGEVPGPGRAPSDARPGSAGGGLVNLNRATAVELESLPRIGPSLAQRILDWRDANGGFSSVDELRNVTGIGDKTFDGLKDRVAV
ncbi:ComEA family DNA-binding protein [Luethyella okanaganae]|uniref:ComEA family DNA-binding protein n=1 Tax=Luethyella okanaganae TaxID=69372 RepID=A0ABW1VD33_9MICO